MMTSNDKNKTPSVSAEADAPRAGITRRNAMNMMTAIAAVPPLALSGSAQATPPAADHDDGDEAYANGLGVAREEFALAWLTRWTDAGGSVTPDHQDEDKIWVGRPEFHFSRDYEAHAKLHAAMAEQEWFKAMSPVDQQRLEQDNYRSARDRYDGKMKELYDLLDEVPGGFTTVKMLVGVLRDVGRRARSAGVAQ